MIYETMVSIQDQSSRNHKTVRTIKSVRIHVEVNRVWVCLTRAYYSDLNKYQSSVVRCSLLIERRLRSRFH